MARVLDRGAVFAGWVGVGMALIVVLAFELIIPIQSLVFIAAPLCGLLIGGYANVRSERWRPRVQALVNGAYAGLVTGIALAVIYVAIRLLFVYGDSGMRADRVQLSCQPGPDCAYRRYLDLGHGDELARLGITDAASFEAAVLREQLYGGVVLVLLTGAGGLVGGAGRALRTDRTPHAPSPAPVAG